MIANRIRLTPKLRVKLNAKAHAVACADEELFLIHLRLSELALLVPLKLLAIRLIRKRIQTSGTTHRLESELTQQREQLQDLSQLSRDWLRLISGAQTSSSEPLRAMLHQLAVDFECSSSATHPNPQSAL